MPCALHSAMLADGQHKLNFTSWRSHCAIYQTLSSFVSGCSSQNSRRKRPCSARGVQPRTTGRRAEPRLSGVR